LLAFRKPFFPVAGTLFYLLVLLFAAGCATYSDRTQRMRSRVATGHYEEGLDELNALLNVPGAEELPSRWKPGDTLMLLERGALLQALGRHETSALNFQAADDRLEMLDIANDTAGVIGRYIYSDSATRYKASPTEKLALNTLNLLNHLALGNLQGAAVEARRFTVMRGYLKEMDEAGTHGVAGSYLAGFVFEHLGEMERALRHYDDALQTGPLVTLEEPLKRLAQKSAYRGKRLGVYLERLEPDRACGLASTTGTGEILTVVNVGRVPHKIPERAPIGAVIGIAGAWITGDIRVLSRSAFKTVIYPELADPGYPPRPVNLKIDGEIVPMDLAGDLSAELTHEYENLKPMIIGAALSRMIARAGAAEAIRHRLREESKLLGDIAALTFEGGLVVADKPDTRSWTLLPARIHVARKRVRAGRHTVDIQLEGHPREVRTREVHVPEGGYAAVVVTTLR